MKKKLKKVPKFKNEDEYHSYIDALADDFDMLNEVKKLSSHLAIIALYKEVELRTKSILKLYLKDEKKIKSLFKYDRLIHILKSDFGVDIKLVRHDHQINELRFLSNAIKHQGKVSSDLANYSGWTKDKEIAEVLDSFNKFSKLVPEYLFDLCSRLENKGKT